MKAQTRIRLRPIPVTRADEIPEDVRAELDREELQLRGRGLPPESAALVPGNILAEQDAAERALVEKPGDDAARLASTSDDDQH